MARIAVIAAGEEELGRLGRSVIALRRSGWQVVVVPGHRAQLRDLAVQHEQAAAEVPAQPLFSLMAMAQGLVGSALTLAWRDLGAPVVAAVTHVLPKTSQVMEAPAVRALADAGYVVVAGGGGGVPVALVEGVYRGMDAALGVDATAQLLASAIGAEALVLITGEPAPGAHLTVGEAELRRATGAFPSEDMGSKVDAAIRFVQGGGTLAAITAPELVLATIEGTASPLEGETGTLIVGPGQALGVA
jgi:carbamate kinase